MTLRIARMTVDDLRIAVDWAAAEGWNPGLDDTEAFHAADPDGFLMGWLGDVPVTAISVVRHSERFGFLGFYLCHPDHRGEGYGLKTWKAGIAHLGDRVVGLDGVPAQEANYEASGFALAHYSRRYAGDIDGRVHPSCRDATPDDMSRLLQMDMEISSVERATYLSAWLSPTSTRRTLVHEVDGQVTGFGTIRTCREGHKIGPLFAPDAQTAQKLIDTLAMNSGGRNVMIDVPDPNTAGVELVRSLGLEPIFSCARMYRGDPLDRNIACIFGETSFELG